MDMKIPILYTVESKWMICLSSSIFLIYRKYLFMFLSVYTYYKILERLGETR
jgi:hypothetical protein